MGQLHCDTHNCGCVFTVEGVIFDAPPLDTCTCDIHSYLQEKLGRGEISTGGSLRVLHFKHNPEANTQKAAAEAKLAQLIAENQALTEQLQAGSAETHATLPCTYIRSSLHQRVSSDGIKPRSVPAIIPLEKC